MSLKAGLGISVINVLNDENFSSSKVCQLHMDKVGHVQERLERDMNNVMFEMAGLGLHQVTYWILAAWRLHLAEDKDVRG